MMSSSRFFLLRELVKRDFQGRYAGSLLGFLWAFLQPLWQLLLYTFVFSTVLKLNLERFGEPTGNFAIFLFCGLLPWLAVQEGAMRAATAVTDNAEMVKKVRFPTWLLIVAVVVSGLIHEAIAGVVFVVVLAATGELAAQGWPLLLLVIPFQVALTLGLGFLLCSFHTLFRDTAQLLGLLLTGWFFLTPIVYPLGQVPEDYRSWIEWNPLTTVVGLYRQALLSGELTWNPSIGRLALVAVLVLAAGWWVFRRLSPSFADEV